MTWLRSRCAPSRPEWDLLADAQPAGPESGIVYVGEYVAPPGASGDAWPAMAGSPDTDATLMARVAAGDRESLAVLYDRHSPLMLALGQRILRGRREAEDILHDVFVEVFKHASEFDEGRGSVKTWLMLRMRCRCLDRVRSASYSRSRSLSDMEEGIAEAPADDAARGPDAARVQAALAALPADQRAVLMLGYFEGLSSSEIAERMGIPIGTVKSRVAAAMTKLRATLKIDGEEAA